MTLRIRGVILRIHGVLPLLWGISLISGSGQNLLASFFALFIHESGHVLLAKCQGRKMAEIEITPYGGVITLEESNPASPLSTFMLALAGPFFSLLGCVLASFLWRSGYASYLFSQQFARANLLLVLINLLPVLPLDGGQMMRSLLSAFLSPVLVTRWLTRLAFFAGSALCAISIYFAFLGKLQFGPAFAGLYLIYAAVQENKQSAARYITALIARRMQLESKKCLPIQQIAVSEAMPLPALIRHLLPGKYHIIHVLAQDGVKEIGIIDEETLSHAILDQSTASLSQIVKMESSKNKRD